MERVAEGWTSERVDVHRRRSVAKSVGLGVAVVALLLVSAGCDPAPPPSDPVGADLFIEVGPSGEVRTRLAFAEELNVDLLQIEREVSESIVQGTTAEAGHDSYLVANGTAPGGYEPGPHPMVKVQVPDAALDALHRQSVRHLDVRLCVPEVDYELRSTIKAQHDARRCDSWTMTTSGEPFAATILMSPDSGPWVRSVVLTAVTILSAGFGAAALRRRPQTFRERVIVAGTAFPGAVAFAIGCATLTAAPHGDALGVAGTLSGTPLTVATNAPLALLLFGFASLLMVPAAFLVHRKPSHSFPPPSARLPAGG